MRNQFERALGQSVTGWNLVPGRCARGMRQRNQVEAMSRTCDSEFSPNYVFQLCAIDKLDNGQSTDRNDQTRPQDLNFIVHPGRAIANLIWRRDAVGAAGIFTRETAADGSEIDR